MQTGQEISYNKKMAKGQKHGEEPRNNRSCSHHRITYVLDSGAYNNKPSKKYENHWHGNIKFVWYNWLAAGIRWWITAAMYNKQQVVG